MGGMPPLRRPGVSGPPPFQGSQGPPGQLAIRFSGSKQRRRPRNSNRDCLTGGLKPSPHRRGTTRGAALLPAKLRSGRTAARALKQQYTAWRKRHLQDGSRGEWPARYRAPQALADQQPVGGHGGLEAA